MKRKGRRRKPKPQKRRHFQLRVSPRWVIMLPKIQHEDEVCNDGNETRKSGIKGGPERC
jgi:hypothetical protein